MLRCFFLLKLMWNGQILLNVPFPAFLKETVRACCEAQPDTHE